MITIKINTSNSAFNEDEFSYNVEIARILKEIADNIKNGNYVISARDINGNKVCTIDYTQD